MAYKGCPRELPRDLGLLQPTTSNYQNLEGSYVYATAPLRIPIVHDVSTIPLLLFMRYLFYFSSYLSNYKTETESMLVIRDYSTY